mgnify:CR=1 FL=1
MNDSVSSNICENCGLNHSGLYGSGRFCSFKCARCFSTKEKRIEINQKISNKLKGRKLNHNLGFKKGFDSKRRKFSDEDRKKSIEKNKERHRLLSFELLGKIGKKSRIIQEQNGKCSWCGISSWRNFPIVLQLDHIDGNRKNNKRENLRVLCPNCHTQTDTYCSIKKVYFSEQDILNLVDNCNSINEIVVKLGLHSGWGQNQIKNILKKYNIMKFAVVS